jgi:opacity protein-like surface antigen
MVLTPLFTRFLNSTLFVVTSCAALGAPSVAHAAEEQPLPVSSSSPSQRQASPLEPEAKDINARLAEQDARLAVARAKPKERSAWLSGGFTWNERASVNPGVATYQSGPGVEFAAGILLTSWLGVRLSAAHETHTVHVHSLGSPAEPMTASDASLQGLSLGAALEPRWNVSETFSVLAGFGIAWDRFSLGEITVETPAGSALVRPRSGVLLEYPITFGLGFSLIPQRLGVVLRGRYAPRSLGSQTGDLFSGGAGAGQTVSQSTGEMLFVPGLPRFAPALSLGLHLELAL